MREIKNRVAEYDIFFISSHWIEPSQKVLSATHVCEQESLHP
jgi:hypothetical protein